MPTVNGSYRGNTMAPQYKTYPTAGLLNPTPSPSITTVPKGVTPPGSVVFDPPAPTAPTTPTTPTYQPLTGTVQGFTPQTSDPAQQPQGRQQLIGAIMGKNRAMEP